MPDMLLVSLLVKNYLLGYDSISDMLVISLQVKNYLYLFFSIPDMLVISFQVKNYLCRFASILDMLVVSLQVKNYLYRFASIPDMLELDHLTVSGDVTFGRNVSLKVCIFSPYGSHIPLIIANAFQILKQSFWSFLCPQIKCSEAFYALGLKGPTGASSNRIVRPSVCLSVRNSVLLSNKVQYLKFR